MKVKDRYDTLSNCLQTLYMASLGDFNYDDLVSSRQKEELWGEYISLCFWELI